MVENGPEWSHSLQLDKIIPNWSKYVTKLRCMVEKLSRMVAFGLNQTNLVETGPDRSLSKKIGKNLLKVIWLRPNESNWLSRTGSNQSTLVEIGVLRKHC